MESNSYPAPRFFERVLFRRLTEYQRVKYSFVRPHSDKINCFEKIAAKITVIMNRFGTCCLKCQSKNYAVVSPNVNAFCRRCDSTYILVIPYISFFFSRVSVFRKHCAVPNNFLCANYPSNKHCYEHRKYECLFFTDEGKHHHI